MAQEKMSVTQKLFTGLVSPTTAARMKAESESWMVRCTYCGYEQSIWAMGGVKYKAAGRSRVLLRCPNCGRRSWNEVYRREGPTASETIPFPVAGRPPRLLLWALILGLFAAAIVIFIVILSFVIGLFTQPVVDAGDAFMTALQSGNYETAYDLCTPDLQSSVGGTSALASSVESNQPTRWNWTGRSLRNGVGQLDGDFSYDGGKTGRVRLLLRQVDNVWRIDGFSLKPN